MNTYDVAQPIGVPSISAAETPRKGNLGFLENHLCRQSMWTSSRGSTLENYVSGWTCTLKLTAEVRGTNAAWEVPMAVQTHISFSPQGPHTRLCAAYSASGSDYWVYCSFSMKTIWPNATNKLNLARLDNTRTSHSASTTWVLWQKWCVEVSTAEQVQLMMSTTATGVQIRMWEGCSWKEFLPKNSQTGKADHRQRFRDHAGLRWKKGGNCPDPDIFIA